MNPYEEYLLNGFTPYTIQNNPFEAGNDKTRITGDLNTQSQIQGELSNKPHYDASGRRYGSTLSDDMFDIKNGRRGNPETSNHPWIGGYNDYDDLSQSPALEQTPEVQTAIQDYINALTNQPTDIRDRIGRKKFIGEGQGDLSHYEDDNFYADLDSDAFENPDFAQYMTALEDYKALNDKINTLQGQGTGRYDGIADDVRYIKSGGATPHGEGYQRPRFSSEDDPALDGLLVNPERLSPRTAQLIAQNMTQDRPELTNSFGEVSGLNPVINDYRRRLK